MKWIDKYKPNEVLSEDMNTMSCKQTLLYGYPGIKKILSAMAKAHHHFYLHHMVSEGR